MTLPRAETGGKEEMTAQARHENFTRGYYSRQKPAAGWVRSGHGDAAHMCDAIATDIERENTVRGRVTNRGREIAAEVRRAGDAIWALRDILEDGNE